MGFKKIREFNLAMLGRQGWRLLAFENTLLGRVFKVKYYPESNFLEEKLGNNPSYVWRSIMEAQILIKRGARWRVGDGRMIYITGQPWLPSLHNPYITTQHDALIDTTVHSLMCTNSTEWDCDVIEDLFNVHDKQLIYNIQLAKNCSTDTWFWAHELNGIYTVKSAYKLVRIC